MAVRVHWGSNTFDGPPYTGTWRGGTDGTIRLKWGGSAWTVPSYCRVKANGNWVDSGYRAFPNPPSDPWVNAWDYGNVQAAWNYAAAGGAPISYYEVQLLHADGSLWAAENSTDNISPLWGVGQDQRAQIRVRSVGVNGLVSAWSNNLRVGIGHPSTPNYGYVQRTRYWESDHTSGARAANDPFWLNVPTTVHLEGIHWRNLRTAYGGYVEPGTNRVVAFYVSTEAGTHTDYGTIGTTVSGDNRDVPRDNWSDGGPWGIVPRGAGWTTKVPPDPLYMLYCDNFWLHGTEYYNNYEIVSWNPEQGNYYW